jgi:membrane-associated protease RseP (regulator of RpoE activity)
MSWLVAVLGLAFLVLIHEAGHFFAARSLGMRPRRFYLGFPPAVAKVNRGGIEYGIGAIPLGGYVKIPGMHRPAPSDLDAHLSRAVHEAPELTGSVERMKSSPRDSSSQPSRPASRGSSCRLRRAAAQSAG